MTPKRFFFVMTGVLCLLVILIIGGAVGGNSLIQKKSHKLVDLKAQNKAIEEQQISLIQAKKDVEKYSQLNSITKAIVPQDKDQAKTIREINNIASANGIELKDVIFSTSNLGQAAAAAPKTTDAAPATSAPVAPSITQVKPVEGIKGVYSLEVTISPVRSISYPAFLAFLEGLESNRRTAHVSKISINPSKDGKSLTFSLTLNAYVKP